MKKVLFVANVAKDHILKFHKPSIKALKEAGWVVDVACSGEETVPYCDNQFRTKWRRSPFTVKTFTGIPQLRKIIKAGDYDIIYCHTTIGGLVARLASIGTKKKGARVVYCAHGFHFYSGAPKWNWLVYFTIEKFLSLFTDAIITVNREDYERSQRLFRRCKAYYINGIGVDESRLSVADKAKVRAEYREELGIPMDAKVLIYLAEISPNKNQRYLVRVMKKVAEKNSNVYLVLAGFDFSNGGVMGYAKAEGVGDKLRVLGWREDVGELYAAADICTASSLREGLGMNVVEAMYCGLPVVATDNRGHRQIITDGVNGLLVATDDEQQFADAILKLVDDEALGESFVQKNLANIDEYGSEKATQAIVAILEEQLRG